jgi:hypothetical protein
LGINVSGEIAGYHNVNDNKGFTYKLSTKKFTNENFPGSTATQVIGINGFGGTCGFYVDQAGVTHGFLDDNNAFKSVDFPGTPFNQLLGRNNLAQAAGYYSKTANGTGSFAPYIYDIFVYVQAATIAMHSHGDPPLPLTKTPALEESPLRTLWMEVSLCGSYGVQLNLICGFNEPHHCHYPSLIAQWPIHCALARHYFHASL